MTSRYSHISIDKATINELPIESFVGNIHVIESVEEARKAVELLRQHKVLGIDTETRPSFRKGKTYKVSLVQISTYTDCYLFRINKIGLIDELRNLLTDSDLLKIGISLRDDFSVLHRVDSFEPRNFLDLQSIVGKYGIDDMSLQKIYAIIFGKKISKSQRLTNWEAEKLTVPQQYYAALDAWACLHIYDALQDGVPFYYTQSKQENIEL
ncbi:MAG: 3'-5' exonuclease domain-containing protein 2 [Bacteroidaceae bacterium]|nr:3'-5' exonuclease domain-containing protein 2 [Bacteroidaceae bacterium]